MLKELDDYDWEEVFKYATPTRIVGAPDTLSTASFDREDVKQIIGMANGENDYESWLGVFELNDGRFVSISAGCDYSGWGCQEGGSSQVAVTETDIIRYGLTDEDRERLGLVLPEEER